MENRIKSFIVCSQLTKLLETCIAIVGSLPHSERVNLPDIDLMEIGITVLKESYPTLVKDGKWNVTGIEEFCEKKENTFVADTIMENFEALDDSVKQNMKSRNEAYFIENFENLIKSVPGVDDDQKVKFSSFATSNSLTDDDKDDIWSFVDFIVDVVDAEDIDEFLP